MWKRRPQFEDSGSQTKAVEVVAETLGEEGQPLDGKEEVACLTDVRVALPRVETKILREKT